MRCMVIDCHLLGSSLRHRRHDQFRVATGTTTIALTSANDFNGLFSVILRFGLRPGDL
jgi:hypothetical protein